MAEIEIGGGKAKKRLILALHDRWEINLNFVQTGGLILSLSLSSSLEKAPLSPSAFLSLCLPPSRSPVVISRRAETPCVVGWWALHL